MGKIEMTLGQIYKRRDGKKAICFRYNDVSGLYSCVILGTDDFFSVHENGKYYESSTLKSQNDLIELWKK
jgi:hypothetical protein